MPNTLAHLGAQGILNHLVRPGIDPKLVALGCLLPDIPWIFQRALTITGLNSDPYFIRLYCIAQASLLVTLCLCGALAFLSRTPKEVFLILSVNAAFHLFLDALQTKLANGVHFFAPISWNLWNAGWFWPESLPTYILTGCGILYLIWHWNIGIHTPVTLPQWSTTNIGVSLTLFSFYFLLPIVLIDGPYDANNHFVKTLKEQHSQVGQPIEFDRIPYIHQSSKDVVRAFDGKEFQVANPLFDHSTTISGRGTISAPNEVSFLEIHQHPWGFRNAANLLGILFIGTMWGYSFFNARRHHKDPSEFGAE